MFLIDDRDRAQDKRNRDDSKLRLGRAEMMFMKQMSPESFMIESWG
jgi:hypothetical protein